MAKIITLDNHKRKGLLFKVDDKGIYILPQAIHWDLTIKENNIKNAQFIDFRTISHIQIRRRGSVSKGILIGYVAGVIVGMTIAKSSNKQYNSMNDKLGFSAIANTIGIIAISSTASPILGGIVGGSYPHQFEVKKDSTSIQSLKAELKKYEWYHADKDILNNK